MAILGNTKKGKANITLNNSAIGTRTPTVITNQTYPNNYAEASTIPFTYSNNPTGTQPTAIVLAILVEDAVDVSGNYVTAIGGTTLSPGVLCIVSLANGTTNLIFGNGLDGNGVADTRNAALSKFGTFRIVISTGSTLNAALRVADGGGAGAYHYDTDGYSATGTGNVVTATALNNGVGGIKCKLTAQVRTAGNWGYNTGTITETLTFKSAIDGTSAPYTNAGLKAVKVGWSKVVDPGSSDIVKKQSFLMSSTGVISVGPVTSGTATGGSTTTLVDTGKNFVTLGVQVGQRIVVTGGAGAGQELVVTAVATTTLTFATATALAAGSVYSVGSVDIDSDWGQASGGDSFYTEVAVGQNFGDVATPSGEKAAIYSIGTTDAADNEQMAYVFASGSTLYVTDSSGNGHTLVAAGVVSSEASSWSGFGQQVNLTAGGNLSTAGASFARTGTQAWTIEAKVNIRSATFANDQWVCGVWGSASNEPNFLLYIHTDGKLNIIWRDAANNNQSMATTVLSTGLFDFAATYDGSVVRLYSNGVRIATSAATSLGSPVAGTAQFWIGSQTAANNANLSIDEVRASSSARYTGASYTPSAAPFTTDGSTIGLYHLDQTHVIPFISSSDVNRRLRTATADQLASSAVKSYQDAGFTTPGALAFDDSGYANQNMLFSRTHPTNTAHAVVYVQAYLTDAYGVVLNAVSVIPSNLRHFDSGVENTASAQVTTAAGRIRWSYTVANNHTAFNRYVRPGGTRAAGSDVTTGPDNPSFPPMSITAAQTYGENPLGDSPGPYPAYAKDIKVTGNRFAGTKEPASTVVNVYGTNSEGAVQAMFTADTTQNTVDANQAPLGTLRQSKTLGTGSVIAKLDSAISLVTLKTVTPGNQCLTDICGRAVDCSTDTWKGRDGYWDVSSASLISQTTFATAGATRGNLEGTLGYPFAFQTYAAPINPDQTAIYHCYSDVAATAATFTLGTDNTDVGATSDVGNFFYFRQTFNWTVADLDKIIQMAVDNLTPPSGTPIRISAEATQRLNSRALGKIAVDSPGIYLYITMDGGLNTPMNNVAPVPLPMMPLVQGTAAASSTATKLVDSTQNFGNMGVVAGTVLAIVGGTGAGRFASVLGVSTTSTLNDTLTFANIGVTLDATSVYALSPLIASKATGGSTTTLVDSTVDFIAALIPTGAVIFMQTGTGSGQQAIVTGVAQHTLTFAIQTTAPDATTTYAIGQVGLTPADWQVYYMPPSNGGYGLLAIGTQGGSTLQTADIAVEYGTASDPNLFVRITVRNLTDPNRHVLAGDQVQAHAQLLRRDPATGFITIVDTAAITSCVFIWSRVGTGGASEYLTNSVDASPFTWVNFLSNSPQDPHTALVDGTNKVFYQTLTTDNTWTKDFRVHATIVYRGNIYRSTEFREVTGTKFQHGATDETSIPFDPVNGHQHIGSDSRAIGDRS